MYLFQKYVGKGSFAIILEGIHPLKPDEVLMFKLLLHVDSDASLGNEIYALKTLGRFVGYDEGEEVLIQKKVPGVDLSQLMPNLVNNPSKLSKVLDDYQKLNLEFYEKTKLIHNDIAPRNVIVDLESGKLSLIDFGLSFLASEDPVERDAQLAHSEDLAFKEFSLSSLLCMLEQVHHQSPFDREVIVKILTEIIFVMQESGHDPRKFIKWKKEISKEMDMERRLELEDELRQTVFKNGENFVILSENTDAYADQIDAVKENRLESLENKLWFSYSGNSEKEAPQFGVKIGI
jgi:serine/threonine protein kinase